MNQNLKLTDSELGMVNMVVSRFLLERKQTPRRQLLLEFQEPDLLDSLVSRSLLRDTNRDNNFLPTLLSFQLCGVENALEQAKESVTTVLHAMKALFLKHEEDQWFTDAQVELQARELGRTLNPNTVWLGLYLVEEFSVLGGWQPADNPTLKKSIRVNERILRLRDKDIEGAWDALVKQRIQWQIQRDSYNPATNLVKIEDDMDKESNILVFISHSSKDAEVAFRLIELLKSALALRDEQIRCTSVDGYRLPAGANTDQALKFEVRQTEAFIGLITPNSMHSAYVLFELGARWGAELHMVPLLAGLGPDALAGPLKPINSISATSDAQLHQLIRDLGRVLNFPAQNPASYTRYLNKLVEEIQRCYPPAIANHLDLPSAVSLNGSRKIDILTRELVVAFAREFVWSKRLPKWTVIVEGKELPIRPLVLQAVGALPNDSITSNAATAKLKSLGFEIRYQGRRA